jgi:hypothetical protein
MARLALAAKMQVLDELLAVTRTGNRQFLMYGGLDRVTVTPEILRMLVPRK